MSNFLTKFLITKRSSICTLKSEYARQKLTYIFYIAPNQSYVSPETNCHIRVIVFLINTAISMFYLNHLQFPSVSTDTTIILNDKILNEKFTKFTKLSIFHWWNLIKSHATRLKSTNKIPFITYVV